MFSSCYDRGAHLHAVASTALGGDSAWGVHPAAVLDALLMQALAAESWTRSGIQHWISDFTTSAFTKAIGGTDTMESVRHVQAADCLKGEDLLEVLRRQGWTTASRLSYITDCGFTMERLKKMLGGATPPPLAIAGDDPTGVHRMGRG